MEGVINKNANIMLAHQLCHETGLTKTAVLYLDFRATYCDGFVIPLIMVKKTFL